MISHTTSMNSTTLTVKQLRDFLSQSLPDDARVRVSNFSDQREGSYYTVTVEWSS